MPGRWHSRVAHLPALLHAAPLAAQLGPGADSAASPAAASVFRCRCRCCCRCFCVRANAVGRSTAVIVRTIAKNPCRTILGMRQALAAAAARRAEHPAQGRRRREHSASPRLLRLPLPATPDSQADAAQKDLHDCRRWGFGRVVAKMRWVWGRRAAKAAKQAQHGHCMGMHNAAGTREKKEEGGGCCKRCTPCLGCASRPGCHALAVRTGNGNVEYGHPAELGKKNDAVAPMAGSFSEQQGDGGKAGSRPWRSNKWA